MMSVAKRKRFRMFLLLLLLFLLAVSDSIASNTTITGNDEQQQQEEEEKEEESSPDDSNDNNNNQSNEDKGNNQVPTNLPPNLLFIVCDQLRYDAIGYVQKRLLRYKEKVKIRTPNIDQLAQSGAWFRDAYCASPSCAPARASLLTGNTIRRTGIEGNKILRKNHYKRVASIRDRVTESESFEQILAERRAYNTESYGKYHVPKEYAFGRRFKNRRVISYNAYDFRNKTPKFDGTMSLKLIYRKALSDLRVSKPYKPGQQRNTFTGFPYTPIRIDPRWGKQTATTLDERSGYSRSEMGNSNVSGEDSLDREHTTTGILGKMAVQALGRMIQDNQKEGVPFSLSVHFNAPHPPIVATRAYLNYYWQRRNNLLVPPNLRDSLRNTPYDSSSNKKNNGKKKKKRSPAKKRKIYSEYEIKELTAVYYGMIAEVDHWVGQLMRRLKSSGLDKNTLVVFSSDHGEMLGAHGMMGKGNLFEEATRVPLIMSFPGHIREKVTVKEPVSHLDIFSTILHYLKVPPSLDKSDGRSLHRFIKRSSFNMNFDERVVVTEIEKVGRRDSGKEINIPNFLVRHGDYKLVLPKASNNKALDMLVNLRTDPHEQKNLLGNKQATRHDIGKAEHLKILLREWMRRKDGSKGFYTSPRYNVQVKNGALLEVAKRRTWQQVDYWESDWRIYFGRPVMTPSGYYKRNEYFYVGRTNPGLLKILSITISGPHAKYFRVDKMRANVQKGMHVRVKVSFRSRTVVWGKGLHAYLEIKNSANGLRRIRLYGGRNRQ